MAITRAQRESIWAHIIKIVMELDVDCELVRALERDGYKTIDLISTLSEDDIMKLHFVATPASTNKAEVLQPVIKYQLSLLVAFLDFVDYTQTTQANFTTLKEWMGITTEQFTEYRTSSQYTARRTNNATPHTGPVHTLRSTLDDWKKGVKRDMTLYPLLKHDHQFDTWNRETKAVADTQGLSNVLGIGAKRHDVPMPRNVTS
jgi:hypothetical protein